MPTVRSYGDACAIARALDVVGERWALLLVRELLLGPQRFSDLRRALPKASSNLVTDRLHELEDRGVLRRRKLAPPAGVHVYELTDRGHALEPVLLALGAWGIDEPKPADPVALSPTSVLLYLRSAATFDAKTSAVLCLRLDESLWTVRVERGRVTVEPGEPDAPDATLHTTAPGLNTLLAYPAALDPAAVSGDVDAIHRLLHAVASARTADRRTGKPVRN